VSPDILKNPTIEIETRNRPCYELLQNNVPTGLMKMTLNSWPPGTEQNVRHNVLAEYIQDTAAKTGVNDIAQYNTKVEHVSKEGNHWKVWTSTLDPGKLETRTRDWVRISAVMY
jgi:cation diffusion facilitator CzcD-associated flavoprotein CzcO